MRMFDPYQYPMSHNHFFPLEFLKLGHPHVQEIIMFFVEVARWYFVPTLYHTEIALTLWNRLKTIFRKLCPNVPSSNLQSFNFWHPPIISQQISPHQKGRPNHGSLNVPIEHHPTIGYMVYNGYYKVMSNIPKMGHLPIPANGLPWTAIGRSTSAARRQGLLGLLRPRAAAVPQRWQRRHAAGGVALLRQGPGPNRADAAGIPCHGSWKALGMETNDPGTWGIWINSIYIYICIYIYIIYI